MNATRDFLKGFGLGLFKWAANRVIFTAVRIGAIIGFFNLIWWKPELFGHPYAPFIGIGLVMFIGILWRLWAAFPPETKDDGGGWDKLSPLQSDETRRPG